MPPYSGQDARAPSIFMHGGEPQDHEVFARNDTAFSKRPSSANHQILTAACNWKKSFFERTNLECL
jgi:hypothetical protein